MHDSCRTRRFGEEMEVVAIDHHRPPDHMNQQRRQQRREKLSMPAPEHGLGPRASGRPVGRILSLPAAGKGGRGRGGRGDATGVARVRSRQAVDSGLRPCSAVHVKLRTRENVETRWAH